RNYDQPLLSSELARHDVDLAPINSVPWLDTRYDLPHEEEPESRKLKHLACDLGFTNPFPHRAVTDVLTMCRVTASHDFGAIVAYS
ncbi:hypothetical protein U2388_15000, partial [Listeria monocytogenes]|uniref:hypothetical protein n=1 Tax=Listeria monocytogenes TaxID=1639 RepID=UPI002FDBD1FE